MDKEKEIKKETIKDVLSTSSFEYSNDVEKRLINEKGKTNLSFGMRCFFWLIFTMLFVLFLNVVVQKQRVRKATKGIVVDIQNELSAYEEEVLNDLKNEFELFKDPLLVQELNENTRKVISTLVSKTNETDSIYYFKHNGEAYTIENNNFTKLSMDSKTYSELENMLNQTTDIVGSKKWFYEQSLRKYKKLQGYKVYNPDGTLNGIIAYSNAISNPLAMISHVTENANMKFYIYDSDKNLIYTNNEDPKTITRIDTKIKNTYESTKALVMKTSDNVPEEKTTENDEKIKKNKKIGFGIAQLSKNVGNALKNETFGSAIINYYDVTGYTVVLDYKRTTGDISRNLIFYYIVGLMIFLAVLYAMTYFYKYTRAHAKVMVNTVMWGLITAFIVTIGFQLVSYINSTKNLAKVQAGILGDAFNTNVTAEHYIEYAALVNHVDLATELESKKDLIANTFANYYRKSGVEDAKVTIYTSPSYISEGIKTIIKENGVFVRLKKSGGERYLNFESVTTRRIRGKNIWIKLSGTIETEISNKCKNLVNQFGTYDYFVVLVGDKSFRLDANREHYVQEDISIDKVKSNEKIGVEKTLFTTRTFVNFDGYTYVVKYTSTEFVVIFVILGLILVICLCAYIDLTRTMNKLVDEEVQDNKYKHLLAEWLSGNITVINENEKDRSAEYDQILLERLRKTNIERQNRVKKEEAVDVELDEDETYQKIKKERDVFGISMFKRKRASINDVAPKSEFSNESAKTNITELKENVVSSIQSKDSSNEEIHDTEKLKVTEERLAIQEVLGEIEVQKNAKDTNSILEDEDKDNLFAERIELSSKDEKLDEKLEKKK